MSEPQFDEQTLRASLADIEAGMVRYLNWFNGERPRDAYDDIHHAWMQGAYVGSLETGIASMNCYGQRQYRMAWFAGFDIAKRIRACGADNARLQERVAELERELGDQLTLSWSLLSRPELSNVLIGDIRAEALRAKHEMAALRDENARLREQLQKWLAVEKQIGPKDSIVGPNVRLIAETEELLGNTQTQEKSE